jgi:hypothetical protein
MPATTYSNFVTMLARRRFWPRRRCALYERNGPHRYHPNSAFDAIAKTLPLGSVGYENKVNEKGGCDRALWGVSPEIGTPAMI